MTAGGTALGWRHGRMRAYGKETPLNNLHLAALEGLGIRGKSLGDSTGVLPGLGT